MSLRGCCFGLAFLLAIASSLFGQTFNFQTLTGPNSARDAVAIDVNRDGHPDIVTIDRGGSAVRVYINNGNGGFPQQGSATYSVPNLPLRLVTADFDSDGIADLVLISLGDTNCTTPSFSFLHGNGDGTFRAPVTAALSSCPSTLTVWDWNGDHMPDIAISDTNNGATDTIRTFQNDGHANFTLANGVTAPDGGSIRAVTAADFNRDGHDDLALVTPGTDPQFLVYVLFRTGASSFTPHLAATLNSPIPVDIATADVNGDGIPDLLVPMVGSNTAILVAINNGTGTTWTYRTLSMPIGIDFIGRPVVANFRLKGLHDIAAPISGTGPTGLPTNAGMAIFPALTTTTWGAPKLITSASGNGSFVGPVADFNRDGRPDVAFAEGPNHYLIALNTTGVSGCAAPAISPAINFCSPTATTTAPVSISARARWDGKVITLTRAYVDGKSTCDAAAGALTCSPPIGKGTHHLTINVWNSAGQVMTSSKTITVN